MKKLFLLSVFYFLVVSFSSCGYVSHSTLPPGVSVAVPIMKNSTYHSGVETKVTQELIKKFVTEGTPVKTEENANFLLSGELVGYNKSAIRWVDGVEDEIEEYRLTLSANITYKDLRSGEVLWSERISGDYDYFIVGSTAKNENTAVNEAAKDLAKNIIDRICSEW
jgi:hypothetical protein